MFFMVLIAIAIFFGNFHATKLERTIDKFPFLTNIPRIRNISSIHSCSGIIITQLKILTTASCLHDTNGNFLQRPYSFSVMAGITNLKDVKEDEKFSTLSKLHPNFTLAEIFNDIGFLELIGPLSINNKTVSLAKIQKEEVPLGTTCTIVGWGATAKTSFTNLSGKLFTNNVTVNKDCSGFLFFGFDIRMRSTQLCAGKKTTEAMETCFQDTGIPLICKGQIVGLATVYNHCRDCKDKGTCYTKLSKFLDLIYEKIPKSNNASI